jgi:hypothetical protein
LIGRELDRYVGQFLKPGQPIATVAASTSVEVRCSLAQNDFEFYRRQIDKRMKVSIPGRGIVEATLIEVRPRGTETLENPALAALYGGPIGVHFDSKGKAEDKSGLKTLKPRFEAKLAIDQETARALTLGQTCYVSPAEESLTFAHVLGRWKDSILEWLFPSPVGESA